MSGRGEVGRTVLALALLMLVAGGVPLANGVRQARVGGLVGPARVAQLLTVGLVRGGTSVPGHLDHWSR